MAVSKNNFKGNPNPVDPDVKIPDAVRRAAEAANAAMNTANPPDPNPPHDPNAPPANDTIKIVEADPPRKLPDQVTPVTVTPAPPAPTNPETPPPPAPPVDDQSWEARYNSMHGQWKRANALNQQMQTRLEALEHMLATPATPAPTPQPTPAQTKLITAKEEEELGPEMVDIMRRAAREVAGPEVEGLKAHISELERKLNGTSQTLATDARGRMLQALDQQMPEWHEVNHAPEFHAWLALQDPFSGVTRKKLLTDAYEGNKTSQVLAFFKSFVSELAATQPPEPQPEPVRQPAAPLKPTLESLAAPGRARTAASPVPAAEKQIIYTSDINAFYDAKRRGLYNGREEEFLAAERELNKAMLEGRVVTNT
jgi:hypothetical protein